MPLASTKLVLSRPSPRGGYASLAEPDIKVLLTKPQKNLEKRQGNDSMRILVMTAALVSWLMLAGCGFFGSGHRVTAAQLASLEIKAKEGGYGLIKPAELFELVSTRQNMILIDATPDAHFREHHILGATNYVFPNSNSTETWDATGSGGKTPEDYQRQLGRDASLTVIIYDEDGDSNRGHLAAAWAKKLGYPNVRRLTGGLAAWQAAGYETRALNDEK